MIQRVANGVKITCEGVDLTTSTGIEFWLRNGATTTTYTPTVTDAHTMYVDIPKSDAMQWNTVFVEVQFGLTDANGVPRISKIKSVPIKALIKEQGYGN